MISKCKLKHTQQEINNIYTHIRIIYIKVPWLHKTILIYYLNIASGCWESIIFSITKYFPHMWKIIHVLTYLQDHSYKFINKHESGKECTINNQKIIKICLHLKMKKRSVFKHNTYKNVKNKYNQSVNTNSFCIFFSYISSHILLHIHLKTRWFHVLNITPTEYKISENILYHCKRFLNPYVDSVTPDQRILTRNFCVLKLKDIEAPDETVQT